MSKKTLLNEATVRRFWKLANIAPINEMGKYKRDEELEESTEELEEASTEELEEVSYKRDEELEESTEELEEMAPPPAARDEDEEPEMDMGDAPDAPPGDEGGVEAEVSISSEDLEALEAAKDVIDQILSAGGEGDMDMGPEEPPMGDEEPMPPAPAGDEDEEEDLMEIDDNKLQEVINKLTDRVTRRVLKEALLKRVQK